MFGRLSLAVIVLVICTVSLLSTVKSNTRSIARSEVNLCSTLMHSCGLKFLIVNVFYLTKLLACRNWLILINSKCGEVKELYFFFLLCFLDRRYRI